MVSMYLHSNISGGLRKTLLFLQEWRFSSSRSPKLSDVGTNRKRLYTRIHFLLVRSSNLGPILHRFRDIPAFMCSWHHPYSTLILEVFPLHQIAHVGSMWAGALSYSAVKLFSKYSKLCEKHTSASLTNRQHTIIYNLITALCIASRGNYARLVGYPQQP